MFSVWKKSVMKWAKRYNISHKIPGDNVLIVEYEKGVAPYAAVFLILQKQESKN